ncbi:MAG: NACHT domain-containing protein, partial [Alphaproteobacteria bacterium]|nr:NACHT domain-containing protein [Alphaproteobacteria bacterium]
MGEVPNQKIPLRYEDILNFKPRGDGSRRRVLIEGIPGCGKTTLIKRMCRDWARGSFAKDSKAVIQVVLRCLPKRDDLTIEDMVLTSVRDKKVVADIAQYVHDHQGQGVVFVLDGFDEISEEMHHSS